jgi:hypothetical protein
MMGGLFYIDFVRLKLIIYKLIIPVLYLKYKLIRYLYKMIL